MLPCAQSSWHRLVFTVRTKVVRFVLLLRILTRFDRAVRPCLALMEPAVENLLCDPRIRENSGEPRGSETRSRSVLRRACASSLPGSTKNRNFSNRGGTLFPEPTHTPSGHSRKLLTRVLTVLCPTLALRCWHLLVCLSSPANTLKSRILPSPVFGPAVQVRHTLKLYKVSVVLVLNYLTWKLTKWVLFFFTTVFCGE